MKKVFKKNQIIITALALMIAVAGYLQYTGSQKDSDVAKEASADTNEGTYEISDEDMYSAEDPARKLPQMQMKTLGSGQGKKLHRQTGRATGWRTRGKPCSPAQM